MGGFHFCHCIRKSPSGLIILLRNSRIIQWYSRWAQKQSLSPRALLQGSIQPWDACGMCYFTASDRDGIRIHSPESQDGALSASCSTIWDNHHLPLQDAGANWKYGNNRLPTKRQTWSKQKHRQEELQNLLDNTSRNTMNSKGLPGVFSFHGTLRPS